MRNDLFLKLCSASVSLSILFSSWDCLADSKSRSSVQSSLSQLGFNKPVSVYEPEGPSKDELAAIFSGATDKERGQSGNPQKLTAPSSSLVASNAGSNTGAERAREARAQLANQPASVADRPVLSSAMLNSAESAGRVEVKSKAPQIDKQIDKKADLELRSSYDWQPIEAAHFLTPNLKGPAVDSAAANLLTTASSWKKQKGLECAQVDSKELLCDKAKALKELMFRYSGNSDFYDAQCEQACAAKGEKARLTGFAVDQTGTQDFRIIEDKAECRYQVELFQNQHWKALAGLRGVCTCLDEKCGT